MSFIITEEGVIFLDKTDRRKIPCRDPEDDRNNPPWVQMYSGNWTEIPAVAEDSWSDFSTDRYVTPVIGAVSWDGEYLAALANDSADIMCQAWHDCMHNNPKWMPENAPLEEKRWRLKIYVMRNDVSALLDRIRIDFPDTPGI